MKNATKSRRGLGTALVLGFSAAFDTAVVVLIVLGLPSNTPAHNYWALFQLAQQENSPYILSSPLAFSIINDVAREDALIGGPLSFFVGGLVFGRLVGSQYTIRRVFANSAGMAAFIVITSLTLLWTLQLVMQHGRLKPHQLSPSYLLLQSAWAFIWIAICVLGTAAGLWWRHRGARAERSTAKSGRADVSKKALR